MGVVEDRWLNIMQAAHEAGVARRTIYTWLKAGRLITQRTAGGRLRILASSLWRKDEHDSRPA